MRKTIAAVILSIFLLCGCGQDMVRNGKTYQTYGFMNMDRKVEGVKYQLVIGNIMLSLLFSETIIVPILLCGLDLYEPIAIPKDK